MTTVTFFRALIGYPTVLPYHKFYCKILLSNDVVCKMYYKSWVSWSHESSCIPSNCSVVHLWPFSDIRYCCKRIRLSLSLTSTALFIIIIIKKGWRRKAGRERLTPYQSEDPNRTTPTHRMKEEKWKTAGDKSERAARPIKSIGPALETRQSH